MTNHAYNLQFSKELTVPELTTSGVSLEGESFVPQSSGRSLEPQQEEVLNLLQKK